MAGRKGVGKGRGGGRSPAGSLMEFGRIKNLIVEDRMGREML